MGEDLRHFGKKRRNWVNLPFLNIFHSSAKKSATSPQEIASAAMKASIKPGISKNGLKMAN